MKEEDKNFWRKVAANAALTLKEIEEKLSPYSVKDWNTMGETIQAQAARIKELERERDFHAKGVNIFAQKLEKLTECKQGTCIDDPFNDMCIGCKNKSTLESGFQFPISKV